MQTDIESLKQKIYDLHLEHRDLDLMTSSTDWPKNPAKTNCNSSDSRRKSCC
jgi:hypothetical protein